MENQGKLLEGVKLKKKKQIQEYQGEPEKPILKGLIPLGPYKAEIVATERQTWAKSKQKSKIGSWKAKNPGGGTQLFSGRGVRPGFPKCGSCELIFASKKGGLLTENFQIWELNCELKIFKFRGLWAENFQIWDLWAKNLFENWGCRG